ncbi:hypothetical protein [Pedobacter paludis]|uniref:DUF4595 domain-containing protein n=1 Tax=Pedobacter paludis TaxID=2203212 RepID=A0A317EWM7_9SPHI|nr:hypothetical protein [Pedobacter paludis]PWS30955.1 hypothetical protein DF947_15240 [Pedobacter paludis]
MNKYLKLMMVAVVAVMSIASCKKDQVEDPITESSCKISTIDVLYNGAPDGKLKFAYDDLGRIKSYTDDAGFVTPYTYDGDKITVDEGVETFIFSVTGGKVVKLAIKGSTNTEDYTYDAAGYLTTITDFRGGTLNFTCNLTYTNGNLTKFVETYTGGDTYTTIYEYSADLATTTKLYVDPIIDAVGTDLPSTYFGTLSKNLLVKSTRTSTGQPTTYSNINNFIYTKDASNKCISATRTGISTTYNNGVVQGTPITTTEKLTFAYDCK